MNSPSRSIPVKRTLFLYSIILLVSSLTWAVIIDIHTPMIDTFVLDLSIIEPDDGHYHAPPGERITKMEHEKSGPTLSLRPHIRRCITIYPIERVPSAKLPAVPGAAQRRADTTWFPGPPPAGPLP